MRFKRLTQKQFELINDQINKITKKKEQWVSATKTHNYMINDTLCDWLRLYGRNKTVYNSNELSNIEPTFNKFLCDKGNDFEKTFIKYIKKEFPNCCIKVADFYSVKDANRTFNYMDKGIPILYSAPIYNQNNKTYGNIDLLIRSDYINKIFKNTLSKNEENIKAPRFNGNYHYRVIDIKYSTLKLASDGIHLLNTQRYPAYKSQVYIYNEAVSLFQGYNPNVAYLCGRRWHYKSKGKYYSGYNSIDRLGVVDFKNYDKDIIKKTDNALDWYRLVSTEGVNWNTYPPNNENMFPNMCVDSGKWNHMKHKIANNIGDISMIWNCGKKQKSIAFKKGIKSWRNKRCNSKELGFKKGKQSKIIDSIIKINRENKSNILPKKIKNNDYNWNEENNNELYIDFETFSDLCDNFKEFPKQKSFNIIYMIGIGKKDSNGNWSYKSFICDKPTKENELQIITEFYEYYTSIGKPPVYYWHAEENFWNKSCKGTLLENENVNWIDMCKIFKEEPIVIKGCFGFSLKPIANKMKEYGMINTVLESECNNGMMAMIKAWKCYNNMSNPKESPIMKDIEKYNEFDCKALFDIMKYIRTRV